jgi:hypothetical protein
MRIYHQTLLVFTLVFISDLSSYSQNQLKNAGFENDKDGWSLWGSEPGKNGHSGNFGLIIQNNVAKWSGADQKVILPAEVTKIQISGWMKTENIVKGTNPWEMARITVEFFNEAGEMVGGYPPVTAQKSGTTDWAEYKRVYIVPEGAHEAKVQASIGNATGIAYFDDIEMILLNETGKNVQAGIVRGPMNEGEWYEIETDVKNDGSNYVDWSSLLDAPAGKHGFLKAFKGHFQFEDGTAAKFWGTNIVLTRMQSERNA